MVQSTHRPLVCEPAEDPLSGWGQVSLQFGSRWALWQPVTQDGASGTVTGSQAVTGRLLQCNQQALTQETKLANKSRNNVRYLSSQKTGWSACEERW